MEGEVLPRLLTVAAHLRRASGESHSSTSTQPFRYSWLLPPLSPRLRSKALWKVAVEGEMVEERQTEEVVGEERQAEPVLLEVVVVLWRQTPCTPPVLV